MIQVTRCGSRFTVVQDGVAGQTYETRGEAIKAALKLKEQG